MGGTTGHGQVAAGHPGWASLLGFPLSMLSLIHRLPHSCQPLSPPPEGRGKVERGPSGL